MLQVAEFRCRMSILPLVRGLGCFGRGQAGHSISWDKCLQAGSEVEGVKSSKFLVWLNFIFPFVLFKSSVCTELSSASAFKMVKMQMADLRYCN